MTTRTMNLTKNLMLGRVEKGGLIVTSIIVVVNIILGSPGLAMGAAAGGALVIASFIATGFVVRALIGNVYSKGFSIFILLMKMALLVGLVIFLFVFTNLNIYGFLIGVTGVVVVIIGENLRGKSDGAL